MNYQVYFQKASLKSFLSVQILVAFALLITILFESALANFDLFLFGTPFLTFTIFFILSLYYPAALPLTSIFIITILHDVFISSLYHSQTFAIILSLIITKRLISFPEQRDFMEIWQGFGIAMAIMLGVQALLFMVWELSLVNFQGLFFQFGISMLFYPFIHAVTMRLSQIFVDMAN